MKITSFCLERGLYLLHDRRAVKKKACTATLTALSIAAHKISRGSRGKEGCAVGSSSASEGQRELTRATPLDVSEGVLSEAPQGLHTFLASS